MVTHEKCCLRYIFLEEVERGVKWKKARVEAPAAATQLMHALQILRGNGTEIMQFHTISQLRPPTTEN